MKAKLLAALLLVLGLGAFAHHEGLFDPLLERFEARREAIAEAKARAAEIPAPAVSAARVETRDFAETVLVTGSLVAREEILVAPEVDGLRVLELRADEGDRVKKGDVLAVLVFEQLDALLAQNDASLARSDAAIAQAKSIIAEAEARLSEANAQLKRAGPLVKDKYLSESVYDQREAAAKTAEAQLRSATSGLRFAEAEKAQVEAMRRELLWRRGNTLVRATSDGVISRRSARIGAIAHGGAMGGGDPMFRIIKDGEIELDAEVPETQLAKVKLGQKAVVKVAGVGEIPGEVRLVSPEVDRSTRLGRVRVFLGARDDLRIGAFARGTVTTARAQGLGIPRSAILYDDSGPTVQVIENGKVVTRSIETGLAAGNVVQVSKGLSSGDLIVAKAGTFLRNGDAVLPIIADGHKVSEATQ